MKLILVRHGETEANAKQILQGKDDSKLTSKGIEQAKEAGRNIKKNYNINLIFCSPLGRCVETLNNILEEYPSEGQIFMSKLIEERDFGEFEGTESHLLDWGKVDLENEINKELGVEKLSDLKKRVNLFLEDLKLEDENSTVLVVSHHMPIQVMVSEITGKPFEEIKVNNGEIIALDCNTELKY